jgi:CheY-like chemotaxis protein
VAFHTDSKNAIVFDKSRLEQVIMNLVTNACEAMPNGGHLTIETANQNHPDSIFGQQVMIAVTDSGVGMDKEALKNLFEPFYTTKGVGEGFGLGLSTVYGLVKQSGGNVWAYSEPGKGTTFKIYLPLADRSIQADLAKLAPTASGGHETIILAEDEEVVRKPISKYLASHGYKVIEAAFASEALEKAKTYGKGIDLLLTDVVMPQMNGKELADLLCQQFPNLAVLYMSGYTNNVVVRQGILEKNLDFIQKPFAMEHLLSSVRKVLDKRLADTQ